MKWATAMLLGAGLLGLAGAADAGEDHWLQDRGRSGGPHVRPNGKPDKPSKGWRDGPHVRPDRPSKEWWDGPHRPRPEKKSTVAQPVNKSCPVCKKAIDRSVTTTWNKRTVAFHCKKCLASWNKLSNREKARKLRAATNRVKKL